jgi:hypothetical protein
MAWRSQPPALLEIATPIAPAQGWEWYDWRSSGKILFTRRGAKAPLEDWDVRTGRTTPISISPGSTDIIGDHIEGQSPDKRWVNYAQGHEFRSIEGEKRFYPDVEEPDRTGCWTPDSQSWRYVHQDYDHVLAFHRLSIVGAKSKSTAVIGVPSDWNVGWPEIEGFALDGDAIIAEKATAMSPVTSFDLWEFDLRTKWYDRKISIPLPRAGEIGASALSPARDRIAFTLLMPPLDTAISQLMSRLRFPKHLPTEGLWIGTLDGKPPRCLGITNVKELWSEVGDIRWLPDGKHLSFLMHDRLWTIPVGD